MMNIGLGVDNSYPAFVLLLLIFSSFSYNWTSAELTISEAVNFGENGYRPTRNPDDEPNLQAYVCLLKLKDKNVTETVECLVHPEDASTREYLVRKVVKLHNKKGSQEHFDELLDMIAKLPTEEGQAAGYDAVRESMDENGDMDTSEYMDLGFKLFKLKDNEVFKRAWKKLPYRIRTFPWDNLAKFRNRGGSLAGLNVRGSVFHKDWAIISSKTTGMYISVVAKPEENSHRVYLEFRRTDGTVWSDSKACLDVSTRGWAYFRKDWCGQALWKVRPVDSGAFFMFARPDVTTHSGKALEAKPNSYVFATYFDDGSLRQHWKVD